MVEHRIEYRDRAFLFVMVIVCSVIFSFLNDLISVSFNGFNFTVLTTNFFYCIVLLIAFREMVHFWDKYLPWTPDILKRVLLQFLFSLVVYLAIQGFIIFVLEPKLNKNTSSPILAAATFVVGITLLIILNVAYMLMYLKWKKNADLNKEREGANYLLGTYDTHRIAVAYDLFTVFLLENGYVYGYDKEHRKIKLQENLSDLEKTLDPKLFFRANRQTIISKEYISSFVLNPNKTCTVQYAGLQHVITISRHRVPLFKKWVQG